MLKTLKKLFEDIGSDQRSHVESHRLEVAVACLLHESKRVDLGEDVKEHEAARDALTHLFGTSADDGEALLEQGREKARQLSSYYAPVSVIKRDFGPEQRVLLVEHLWRIAYADGKLDRDEDHYVRKIAHLLYVPNTQTMLARSRAQRDGSREGG
jgi:uncharacterized tellurite resistance protein B-like protein